MRRVAVFRAAAFLLCVCVLFSFADTRAQFNFSGVGSGAVFTLDGKVLLDGSEPDKKLDIAGLAKLPALLLVCEAADGGAFLLSDILTVTESAARAPGPTAFLESGENVPAGELIKAAVMIGASDAVITLAQHCLSEREFVEKLNLRLTELGIEAQYTDIVGTNVLMTCRELALVGAALLKSPSYAAYSNVFYDELIHEDGRRTELASSNLLIRSLTGCAGVGTGSSNTAGYCGVFAAKRGESGYIAVVLGARSSKERAECARQALELAFSSYRTVSCIKKGETAATVPVVDGVQSAVGLIAKEDVELLLMTGEEYEEKRTLPESLTAPVTAGTELGYIEYLNSDGLTIARTPLIPESAVRKAVYLDRVKTVILSWLHA